MASPARTRATILAHHLYDFAECEHRVALDATLDRELRSPPDAAMELLFRHGQEFERTIVEPLGYPAVAVEHGDWDGAFAHTVALMRDGARGIDQGVLLDGARLARPDLLERVEGSSELGEFHFIPGDVKSARTTRSDAVFQVGFAALLLEAVQGRRPDIGFLVLGDGRRERLDLESIQLRKPGQHSVRMQHGAGRDLGVAEHLQALDRVPERQRRRERKLGGVDRQLDAVRVTGRPSPGLDIAEVRVDRDHVLADRRDERAKAHLDPVLGSRRAAHGFTLSCRTANARSILER